MQNHLLRSDAERREDHLVHVGALVQRQHRRPHDYIGGGAIAILIDRQPGLKTLAFLVVVGVVLMAETLGIHVPKGYVCFAMFFSLVAEAVNIRIRANVGTTET